MMTDQPSFWTRHYEITADAADLSTDLTPLLTALAPSFQDLLAVQLPFHVKAIVTYRISRTVRLTDDDDELVEEESQHFAHTPPWVVHPTFSVEERIRVMSEELLYLSEQLLDSKLSASPEGLRLPAPAVGRSGGTWEPLPDELKGQGSRGIWNPKNQDERCFEWCVRGFLLGLCEVNSATREKATRINCNFFFDEKRSLKVVEADFRDLPTPTSLLDISSFEERNAGRLAIVVWKWMHIEWEGATFFEETVVRTPTVHARQNALHVINLLQLEGGHYCLLHNMDAFRSHKGSKLQESQRAFIQKENKEALKRHATSGSCGMVIAERSSGFCMPKGDKTLLKYKPGSSAELHPVFVAADLEVFTAPNPHALGSVKAVQNWVASAGFAVKFGGGYVPPAELQGGIAVALEGFQQTLENDCDRLAGVQCAGSMQSSLNPQ